MVEPSMETMNELSDYELVDFGRGRKLEQFGKVILDRPCPAADQVEWGHPAAWQAASARYERASGQRGDWSVRSELPDRWSASFSVSAGVASPRITFELAASPFGHVGVFPEQAANWQWICRQSSQAGRPITVLNLFAYTGGSTLAAAAAGAAVVHVDAARNTVDRARRNAAMSGLEDRPIRWIVEDVEKFCRRELRRGKRYDAVILDPPSYGHGPKGSPWSINRDFQALLELCGQLTAHRPTFFLVTCHSPGIGPRELAAMAEDAIFEGRKSRVDDCGLMLLQAVDRRQLPCGVYARWHELPD